MRRITSVAFLAAASACSPQAPAPEDAAPADPTFERGARRPALEDLRALGYAAFDEPVPPPPVGAVVHDRARIAPGWTLYADDQEHVRAVDADGTERRTWHVPGRTQVEFALPLAGGRLIALSVDQGLTLLEPDGSVAWALDLACHHDVCPRPGGEPGERIFAVATHVRRPYRGRMVSFDRIEFVDERTGAPVTDGSYRTLDSWDLREEWGRIQRDFAGVPHPLDAPAVGDVPDQAYDYFHLNSIQWEVDAAGRDTFLLCLRNVNTVISVDAEGAVLWHADPTELDWPHMPRRLTDAGIEGGGAVGDVLVFDNGKHRDWSRAVAFGPEGRPTWEWRADPPQAFHSDARGSVQRLPNGNTLLAESERGRLLEVAPDGAVVWEFFNPDRMTTRGGDVRLRRIYRCARYPEAMLAAPR